MKTISVEAANGLGVITFNRPEVHNALNEAMVDELHKALGVLERDGNMHALIFTGAGDRTFLGGADISELAERRRDDALRKINTALFRRIEELPMPTIAAIRGYCLGGGCELALACDMRVAGLGAVFGQPEVLLGILPGAGATWRLARLVGLGAAKELIFTGRRIGAEEARQLGLVNRVVPDAEVMQSARELAEEIAKASKLAVRLAKRAIHAGLWADPSTAMTLESTMQAVLFEDGEKARRMEAFLSRKRKHERSQGE